METKILILCRYSQFDEAVVDADNLGMGKVFISELMFGASYYFVNS